MMNTTSSLVRAAAIVTILALVPASAAVAQHHKGQHKGAAQQQSKNMVRVAAKVTQPQPASTLKNPNGAMLQASGNHQNPPNAVLVSTMHSTLTHLNKADHDYNGHRSRAMHEINTAIRHLGLQNGQSNSGIASLAQSGNANGTNTAIRAGTGTGPKVPQATSDTHLREAQKSLQGIDSRMNINGVNPHSFTQAKASVQNAIRELNLALNDR
jgi:hypothetical protein